jgi:hypothetical protein
MVDSINALGKTLKKMFKKTDEELGIDGGFTRPAALTLFAKLHSKVKDEMMGDFDNVDDDCELSAWTFTGA